MRPPRNTSAQIHLIIADKGTRCNTAVVSSPKAISSEASALRLGFNIPVELQLLDGDRERIGAHIRRVNSGFFQLRSPLHLRDDRKLELLYEGRRIEAEVVYSKKQELGIHHVGIRTCGNHGAVRKELRLPVDVQATVSVPGSTAPLPARVSDMSQSGLGLILRKEIPPGTAVSVDLGHGVAFGEIRYCKSISSKGRYRAGFWLEEFIYRPRQKKPIAGSEHPSRVLTSIARFASRMKALFVSKARRRNGLSLR